MTNAQLMAAMEVVSGALLLALIAGLNIVSGGLFYLFIFYHFCVIIALTQTSVCSYRIMVTDQRLKLSNSLTQKIIEFMRLTLFPTCLFEIMEILHISTHCCDD